MESEIEKLRRHLAKREQQLRCALGLAYSGKDGRGYAVVYDMAGRAWDVVEYPVAGSAYKPDLPVLVPADEYDAALVEATNGK